MAAYSKQIRRILGEKRKSTARLALALTLCVFPACEGDAPIETVLFERAEASFALGDYEGARTSYLTFVETHPHSPLAPVARQRLAAVERELDTIMGRRGAPAPLYASPYADVVREPLLDEELIERVEAPSLPTFDR